MGSRYKQDFTRKRMTFVDPKEVFHREKEFKIINPHSMERLTTNAINFSGQPGPKAVSTRKREARVDGPMATTTDYKERYPDWKNGKADFFIEKKPQFPFYSLPFRGQSSSKHDYSPGKIEALKKQAELREKHMSPIAAL